MRRVWWGTIACFVLSGLALAPVPARAGTPSIVVDEDEDENNTDGDCSLREAIASANTDTGVDECEQGDGSDRIEVPAGIFLLDAGSLPVNENVLIAGAGKSETIIKRDPAAIENRVFEVSLSSGEVVLMSDIMIANGSATLGGGIANSGGALRLRRVIVQNNSASEGAGIWSDSALRLNRSIIRDNQSSGNGGGVYNNGTLQTTETTFSGNDAALSGGALSSVGAAASTIRKSTFLDNSATSRGGGIYNLGALSLENSTLTRNTVNSPGGGFSHGGGLSNGGAATLSNLTVTRNRAKNDGSGIIHDGGAMTIRNSIVSDNPRINGTEPQNNCFLPATHTSDGYNLENGSTCDFTAPTDLPPGSPRLNPLRDNGGPTRTHAPKPSSPALDAGSPGTQASGSTCKPTDQRSVRRPQDGPDANGTARCDVGAFELKMVKHSTDLSLDLDRHLRAEGRLIVRDGFNDCRKRIRVLVQRKKPGGWDTIANPKTNRRGRYGTGLPDHEGVYRATTKAKKLVKGDIHICRADKSGKKKHRH